MPPVREVIATPIYAANVSYKKLKGYSTTLALQLRRNYTVFTQRVALLLRL